jgi:hypothetical protein
VHVRASHSADKQLVAAVLNCKSVWFKKRSDLRERQPLSWTSTEVLLADLLAAVIRD